MINTGDLVGKTLYGGAIVTICTSVTMIGWNAALLPMFPMLPKLIFGNLFVVFTAIYILKALLTSPTLMEIAARLEHMDKTTKIIHTNDVAQRAGMIEILAKINNNLGKDQVEVEHTQK